MIAGRNLNTRPEGPILGGVTHRAAPGVIAGCAGLVLAVAAMLTDQAWLVALAGVAALVAGLFALGLADRLRRSTAQVAEATTTTAAEARAESDEMAARAARFETEARTREPPTEASPPADHSPITDGETGLFNAAFFAVTLDKRVSSARRGLRPLTVALLEPVVGLGGEEPTSQVDEDVAEVVLATLRDSDIACRLGDDLVALILEDTPENGAVWTVERVRRRPRLEPGPHRGRPRPRGLSLDPPVR